MVSAPDVGSSGPGSMPVIGQGTTLIVPLSTQMYKGVLAS